MRDAERNDRVVALRERPATSALTGWCSEPTFWDAYAVRVSKEATPVRVFVAVFGHHPPLTRAALLLRNRVAKLFGLAVPEASLLLHTPQVREYVAGEVLGPWPVFLSTPSELVVGRDNAHLDFRLSILMHEGVALICTVCRAHGVTGRIYLQLVRPFHVWGVTTLLRRALLRPSPAGSSIGDPLAEI